MITMGTSQVRVFAENPTSFIDSYSKEFDDAFMEVLRRKGENVSAYFKPTIVSNNAFDIYCG